MTKRDNDLSFYIAHTVIQARIASGLTQVQLAKRIGVQQPTIPRIENASHCTTLRMIAKISKATGNKLKLEFIPLR